jgi:hypothetical protein
LLLAVLVVAHVGCSRTRYRIQADRQAMKMIDEKSNDPRWAMLNFNLGIDPRSRYFDPYDPDREPMPPDDPAAHQFMQRVAGMKHYRRWYRNGVSSNLQNPGWREQLANYVPVTETGAIKLNLEDSVKLGYIHSPDLRTQLETLYLSALDVTTERFRFATQFYGGYGPTYTANGAAVSGTGSATSTLETSTNPTPTTVGAFPNGLTSNPGSQPTRWDVDKQFATGGQLLVGFANSFMWQFAGTPSNNTNSILNFNFVQPLLRAGGRAVALEQLTRVERTLLENLRAFQRYRQGFFTNIAVGDFSNITGPQRIGGFAGGTGLTGFTGQGSSGLGGVGTATNFGRAGFGAATNATGAVATGTGFAGGGAGALGGFVGLLQQLQQIRNSQDSLNLQLRTLSLLEANLEAGVIDITQVDTLRQNIETERANLLQSQVALENSLDTFKRQILGLPPDLLIDLDDTMIQQFRLIDPDTRALEDEIADFIDEVGKTEAKPKPEDLAKFFDKFATIRPKVAERFAEVRQDLEKMNSTADARFKTVEPEEIPQLKIDRKQLAEAMLGLEQRYKGSEGRDEALRMALRVDNAGKTADALVALAAELSALTQELSLVQARARLESVTIEPVTLTAQQGFEIARASRFDWANNRATVCDTWRLITYNANALRSILTVDINGDMGTIGNNPLKFSSTEGTLQAGLRFDAPFTRLVERNNYRQSLINYQSDRRTLIQFEDSVNQTVRQDLRTLKQLELNLEIQRRAVVIAVRRVDKTLEDLNEPPPPLQPGQSAPELSPTAAFNLLTAISDLRNTQNNFLSVWLNYYSERVQLDRDLGIMLVDDRGMWVEQSLDVVLAQLPPVEPMPPSVPEQWLRDAGLGGGAIEGGMEPLPPVKAQPTGPDPSPAPPGNLPEGKPAPQGAPLPAPQPSDGSGSTIPITLPPGTPGAPANPPSTVEPVSHSVSSPAAQSEKRPWWQWFGAATK